MDRKMLCEVCKTGKIAYKMDPKAPMCPYIGCYKNGECSQFIQLDERSDEDVCNPTVRP